MNSSRVSRSRSPYPYSIHKRPPCSGCGATHENPSNKCFLDTCEFSSIFDIKKRLKSLMEKKGSSL